MGPLNLVMKLSKAKLEASLPGYEIVIDSYQAEGDMYEIFRVVDEGSPVMELEDYYDGEIKALILEPTILGPHGVHTKTTLEALGLESKLEGCYVGAESEEWIHCSFDGFVDLVYSTEGLGDIQMDREYPVAKVLGHPIYALRWPSQKREEE